MKIALFVKVSNHMIDNEHAFNSFIGNRVNRELWKYKFGWIGNSVMTVGFYGDDFIKNQSTVSIHFDYYKTPRFIRNPAKKKNNFIKRYL